MIELLPLFKALHIVGFVAWFAGLFYLVRMFVYHAESMDKSEPERSILTKQFSIMQKRVYQIICLPGMNITWLFGSLMIYSYGMEWFKLSGWLHIKLLLLLGLSAYQYYMGFIVKKLEKGEKSYTSQQFRMLNEVPTLFLLTIVLLGVFKNGLNVLYTIIGLLLFMVLLMAGIKIYKKIREK